MKTIFISTVTGCPSICTFASLVCVPVGITSPAVGLNIPAITAGIKKYKLIIKKKKEKHDKIVLLGKDKLNTIEVLIYKAIIDSYISHDKLVSVCFKRILWNESRKKILKLLWNICIKAMETYCVSCKKYTANKIQLSEKLNKVDWCFYQIVLFVARENQLLEKIKNSTFLINLKWIKALTNVYWLATNLCHLKHSEFIYSAYGPFTKHRERIQKFRETEVRAFI